MPEPDRHASLRETPAPQTLIAMWKARFEASPLDATKDFREALGKWFSSEGKDFPWRRTRDPYAVLVSEMMLQQTRIMTVLGKGYFTRFLDGFPDVHALAAADDTSLLKAWEGLGYYRRARMLREAAAAVISTHGGVFPEDESALLSLPGIGPYTAAALLSFAFGKPSALVDGNVSRVLSRLMDDNAPIDLPKTQKRHRQWALAFCDPENPRRHHYAMMELGQTICRPGSPLCEVCPVARFCKTSAPENLPVKKKRAAITEIIEHAIWMRDADGRILLHRESGSRRTGLWKLPLRPAQTCAALKLILKESYPITRYKVTLNIHQELVSGNQLADEGDEWIEPGRLASLPMAAPFRRAVTQLLSDF
jgi:A/G-specific adenine glycosylase